MFALTFSGGGFWLTVCGATQECSRERESAGIYGRAGVTLFCRHGGEHACTLHTPSISVCSFVSGLFRPLSARVEEAIFVSFRLKFSTSQEI